MEKYLTDNDIFELAFEKLNVANPKVDKVMEMAELMDLEYDETENAYLNPDYIEVSEYVSIPDCYKCDPVKAANTMASTFAAKYQCKCGHIYEVPTPTE